MCGIVGIYNFENNRPVSESELKKMCDVIIHRGPDDEGYYVADASARCQPEACGGLKADLQKRASASGIGLGIRRLSIIDLETGHQPVHNENKTIWIILNGAIYNFLELREELQKKGHKFYTKTDTETIVHLYEEYGENCVRYLRGMFAFALWDSKKEILYIARDRVGKKPLFYTISDGSMVFASEIKSILVHLNHTPEINLNAINLFLTYQYIPQPITIFKNIYKLPPASYMICNKTGIIKIQRYWELDFRNKEKISFTDTCTKIKNILNESTKLRLKSDVPLGAFLSGGHDSSIIVGLMAKNSGQRVKTFSVGFKDEDFSELKYAKLVAEHFGTDHTEIIVEPKMTEILPKLVWHYDQPFADTSMIPSYYVSNVTRRYVTVALNGDGGDENFCGYLRYVAINLSSMFPFELLGTEFYKKVGNLIPLVETTSARHKLRYFRRLFTALGEPIPVRNVLWHCFFTNEIKNFIYSDFMKQQVKENVYDYLVNTYNNAKAEDVIDRVSYTDINTYLPEDLLVKMDIASMANSLEARSPFLDHKLLEFTASIPSRWKIKWTDTKHILKQTFKDFLPKKILHREKQGFGLPIGRWLRQDLQDYVKEILFSGKTMNRPYFNFRNIKTLVENHLSGKEDHGYRIFALLNLELWHRVFVDKEMKF